MIKFININICGESGGDEGRRRPKGKERGRLQRKGGVWVAKERRGK